MTLHLQQEYIITELQIRGMMIIMNQDCEMDQDEYEEIGKTLRSRVHSSQQSERDKVLDAMLCHVLDIKVLIEELRKQEEQG